MTMAGRLAAYVHVTDSDGRTVWLGPDDTVPGWAAEQITNPKAWADTAPSEGDGSAYPDGEPDESWKVAEIEAYADAHGVDLGGATKKAEMLAAVQG